MVFESESATLIDVPGLAFDGLIAEAKRPVTDSDNANRSLQRALLLLTPILTSDLEVDGFEFISDGRSATVDIGTLDRIKLLVRESVVADDEYVTQVVGRMLELDLAAKSLRVHQLPNDPVTLSYPDLLEESVIAVLDSFVVAEYSLNDFGQRELLWIESASRLPVSRFNERRDLARMIADQGIKPIEDFNSLAMEGAETVSLEEFDTFLDDLRREAAE